MAILRKCSTSQRFHGSRKTLVSHLPSGELGGQTATCFSSHVNGGLAEESKANSESPTRVTSQKERIFRQGGLRMGSGSVRLAAPDWEYSDSVFIVERV